MTSSGTIPLSDVWKMLDACASGYAAKLQEHTWAVRYGGKTAYLPLGPHGTRKPKKVRIEVGHIRHLARHLGILDCAKQHLGI